MFFKVNNNASTASALNSPIKRGNEGWEINRISQKLQEKIKKIIDNKSKENFSSKLLMKLIS